MVVGCERLERCKWGYFGISNYYLVEAKLRIKEEWKEKVEFGKSLKTTRAKKKKKEYAIKYERLYFIRWKCFITNENGVQS